jgi:hypothetical protein
VRDGIFLTKAGLPTVVIVQKPFENAARAQAEALGLPQLKLYVYPQHGVGALAAEETEKGLKAAAELAQLLEQ